MYTELRDKSIVEFLSSEGHKPLRVTEKNSWFISPFRNEGNPSFIVNNEKNRWKDMGDGSKGSLIDLVMKINSCGLKEACIILGANEHVHKHVAVEAPKTSIDVIEVLPLTDIYLLSYMRSRHIPDEISTKYCKEVYFYFPKKEGDQRILRAVGWKNQLGGYEMRTSTNKFATQPKCFTRIPGDTSKYVIFESYIDFLSWLVYYNRTEPKYETYVLNGVGILPLLIPYLEGREGFIYSDNDAAGQAVVDTLQQKDMRGVFKEYKDFNEMLTNV